jgi:hypothetical protein
MSDINYDSLNIEIILDSDDYPDTSLGTTMKRILPRAGEIIWMPYNWEWKKKYKTRAFVVREVCHHIMLNSKGAYDNIVVYVEPIKTQQ